MNENFRELNSIDDCIKHLGYDPATALPDVSKCPEHLQELFLAQARITIGNEAMTNKWEPDWNNLSEPKWIVVTDMEETEENPSGFALWGVHDCTTLTFAGLGPRHHWPNQEVARHAFEVFKEEYRIIAQKKVK